MKIYLCLAGTGGWSIEKLFRRYPDILCSYYHDERNLKKWFQSRQGESLKPLEPSESDSNRPNANVHLYEVEVRNRVVKGRTGRRIRGTQSDWHHEKLFYLARSESEAAAFAIKKVSARRMLGIPRSTKRKLRRDVEIINVRRRA